ncbi:MAG: hypothetical protein ACD_61C00040G0004 [uncultured bacterium]|nr:MAG: hypothetical protein ACD_61C00040G0004 [uncultured bacterium]
MKINDLFLLTLDDIKEKSQSDDYYKIFMTAALLRKLFLDGGALVDLVNRNYKLGLKFTVNNKEPIIVPGLFFWTIQDGFDPETSHCPIPLEVDKTAFLNRKVMMKENRIYTVHDLIDYLCHIGGVVHHSSPKEEKEKILKEVEQPIVRSLLAINRVVLKGLRPLEMAIKKTI